MTTLEENAYTVLDPLGEGPLSFDWKYASAKARAAGGTADGFLSEIAPGETVTGATWTVTPAGLTQMGTPTPSVVDGVATAWFTGGTPGILYKVECRVTTSLGRKEHRSRYVMVRDL